MRVRWKWVKVILVLTVTMTTIALVFFHHAKLIPRHNILPGLRSLPILPRLWNLTAWNLTNSQTLPVQGLRHTSGTNLTHPAGDDSNGTMPVRGFSAGRKKIVYTCDKLGSCGGWADRQKGIVSAYVLAAMLDRDFGIHMSVPCEVDGLVDVNKEDWRVKKGELEGPGSKHYSHLDDKAVVFAKQILSSPDLDQQFPDDLSSITWNMEVVQFLQKHPLAIRLTWLAGKSLPEVYKLVLNALFTLKPDLQAQLKELHNSRPPGTRLVCAQVRLGNHKSFPDSETLHTFEEFPILVNFLAKYNDSRHFRILITSDSVEIVERAKAKFPQVVLSIPGPITHTDKTQGAQACAGMKKAIVDQYALAACGVLVISESGIGKIASFLRNSDQDLFLFHDTHIEPFTRTGVFPNRGAW